MGGVDREGMAGVGSEYVLGLGDGERGMGTGVGGLWLGS